MITYRHIYVVIMSFNVIFIRFDSMKIIIVVSLKVLVLFAFLFGAYEHLRAKPNMCAMTYMYQTPEYIPVALDKETQRAFPAYKLYSYGDGSYARRLRAKLYEGIPVLFLPGNSGSYKQVRSLASVSITKAASNKRPFHFNYFAADLNEELSALYGYFLFKQTEFASICIKVILELYDDEVTSKQPNSVIIVGHSMGGIIARAVFTLENFDPRRIQLIMTLATPHSEPVFAPDSYVDDFYVQVNGYWNRNRNSSLSHVNLVSISGGREDRMVRSDLANLALKGTSSTRDIYVMSNAIPGVWVGMDHLCIVWCNQLVLAIVRSGFKLIDSETKQLISDSETQHLLLTRLLVDGAHIKSHPLRLAANWAVPMSYEHLWTFRQPGRWEYGTGIGCNDDDDVSALLITVAEPELDDQHLFISTLNLHLEPWIFTCIPNGDLCHVSGVPSCKTLHLPSTIGARKVFHCSKIDSRHFVIKLPSDATENVKVFAETFNPADRTSEMFWPSFAVGIEVPVPKNSLITTVKLRSSSETWEAYRIQLRASGSSCTDYSFAVVHLSVPWSIEDTFESIDSPEGERSIVIHSARPLRYSGTDGPEIRLYLNPNCHYKISVRFSLLDALAQVVRFYIYTCPAFVAAATLHVLSMQLTGKREERSTSVPLITLTKSLAKVYAITTILDWIIGMEFVEQQTHLKSELYKRWWSAPVLLFVYVASSVAVTVCLWAIRMAVIAAGKILAVLPQRRTRSSHCDASTEASWKASVCTSALLAAVVLVVGHFVCGAAATLITVIILILRSINLETSKCDLHLVCYLIWGLIFGLACPTLVVRMVNFRIGQFIVDPSLMLSYFMAIMLFGRRLPFDDLRKSIKSAVKLLSGCRSLLVTGILLSGAEHVYLIPWFLIADCLLLLFWAIIFKDVKSSKPD